LFYFHLTYNNNTINSCKQTFTQLIKTSFLVLLSRGSGVRIASGAPFKTLLYQGLTKKPLIFFSLKMLKWGQFGGTSLFYVIFFSLLYAIVSNTFAICLFALSSACTYLLVIDILLCPNCLLTDFIFIPSLNRIVADVCLKS